MRKCVAARFGGATSCRAQIDCAAGSRTSGSGNVPFIGRCGILPRWKKMRGWSTAGSPIAQNGPPGRFSNYCSHLAGGFRRCGFQPRNEFGRDRMSHLRTLRPHIFAKCSRTLAQGGLCRRRLTTCDARFARMDAIRCVRMTRFCPFSVAIHDEPPDVAKHKNSFVLP